MAKHHSEIVMTCDFIWVIVEGNRFPPLTRVTFTNEEAAKRCLEYMKTDPTEDQTKAFYISEQVVYHDFDPEEWES